jgi:pilus assembly protein CpaB
MRSKSILLLALALGCGLVASIGISQVMERRHQTTITPGETEAIFVAMHDIPSSEPLTPQNVKLEEWPKEKVPTGAITSLEQLEDQRARIKMFAGEPIVQAKLIDEDDVNSPSHVIPKGYRVVAVRVDAVSGGGSLIQPHDRVDVLVYLVKNPSHNIFETKTKTILQDIRVFAVDTVYQRNPDQDEPTVAAKTISLLVTPDQAEKVTLASEMGSIRLILRNDQDSVIEHTEGADASVVLGSGANSASNRSSEHTGAAPNNAAAAVAGVSTAAKSLLDLIKQHRESAPTSKPAETAEPWKMTLFLGSEIEEMSVNPAGLPTVIGSTGEPAALPSTPAEQIDPAASESTDDDGNEDNAFPAPSEEPSPEQDASTLLD